MPRVSVIIPTYDRADVLGRAVDSVLAQTRTDLEVLVVDDASTDRTPDVVADYDDPRVRYLRHAENRGGSAARNTGIGAANGDYLAFLDSDDAWRPRKLERQLDRLAGRSDEWVAAYCDATFVDGGVRSRTAAAVERLTGVLSAGDGRVEGGSELIGPVLADDLHTSAGSTLLVERDTVTAIGGFDESFARFQDAEFLVRVLDEGKLAHVPEPLVERFASDDPAPDAVRAADRHYLETFSDTVASLEAEGRDVVAAHEFMLARCYLAAGRFREAARHFAAGRPPRLDDVPGLAYGALSGCRARVADGD